MGAICALTLSAAAAAPKPCHGRQWEGRGGSARPARVRPEVRARRVRSAREKALRRGVQAALTAVTVSGVTSDYIQLQCIIN